MKKIILIFGILGAALLCSSCIKDRMKSDDDRKSEGEYFDFKNVRDVTLSLNYGYSGYSFLFEIYAENPYDANFNRNENIEPIYKAYTNKSSSFNGTISVPTYVNKIYVCSDAIGVPSSIEVTINNNKANYSYGSLNLKSMSISPSKESISINKNKRIISSQAKLYGLYDNYLPSRGSYYWQTLNSKVPNLYSTLQNNEKLTDNSTLGELLNRLQNKLRKKDNSAFIANEKDINISIAKSVNGTAIDGAHLDLVYLKSSATMHSAIAYYYYKTDKQMTANDLRQLPKFVVLPRVTSNTPSEKIKIRLQYFGEDGMAESGTDVFPGGYTVGWLLITDLFYSDANSYWWSELSTIEGRIKWAYSTADQYVYSNQTANYNQTPGCISLYDQKSKKIIVGFEDHTFHESEYNDKSYEDVLFYVDADPIEAVNTSQKPTVSEEESETITTEKTKGTYLFEDIWPTGGDYDLNDLIVEYTSEVVFNNKNEIKKIIDTFTPVHEGASYKNAFGYIIKDAAAVGTINLEESNFKTKEEDNQFIVFDNITQAINEGKSYRVVRDFTAGSLMKTDYKFCQNPFIAVRYRANEKQRVEVHLPKEKATSWAEESMQNQSDDAFYINRDGKHPFALNLSGITGFVPVTEKKMIGSAGEYPYFNSWVNSFGSTNADWYLHK